MVELIIKRTVMKIGNSLGVTLPQEILDILKIKEGDEVGFKIVDNKVVIEKVKK